MSEAESLLMTADEVARSMNVAVRSIWRWRSCRQIPEPVIVAGSVRWRRQELMDWINRGCPPLPPKG